MKEKIVFFGAGSYVSRIIKNLSRNFEVYVFTSETGQKSPLILYCKNSNIPYISIRKFDQKIIDELKKIRAKIAVLAYFGIIVPSDVLNLFELGIINVHPSLLPKFRGPTPVQSAILAGEETTGVSIIKLDEEVDHGPILSMIDHTIAPNDTSDSLYRILFQKGADLLSQVLPKYIAGEIKPIEQDHSKATFTERLTRKSGYIDLSSKKLEIGNWKLEIARKIRAYHPWPGVWFRAKLNNVERIIKLFPGRKIQVEGKNVMKLSDFVNGYTEGQMILEKLSPASTRGELF